MAVYTHIGDRDLDVFLADYNLGRARTFKGIAEGVENSNYYLETRAGRFVLTLFEKRTARHDLPYFITLKQHLAANGFACPVPVTTRNGQTLHTLAGRPAVIVSFLDGLSPQQPNTDQCRNLGVNLARLHMIASGFHLQRSNNFGLHKWSQLWQDSANIAETLQPGLLALVDTDLDMLMKELPTINARLPSGTIHADLFPDNTLFVGNTLVGTIDFYFACTDTLAYDLAICLNAWAFDNGITFNRDKSRQLIAGYESVRPLSPAEKNALPLLCRGAALRFFLTRLADWRKTAPTPLVKPKNPLDYAIRLAFHRTVVQAGAYGIGS